MSGGASVLLDLLFPPRCAFCRALLRRGESGLCQRCQRELPWISGPAAEQKPEFVSLCASPLWYEGAVRASFHRFKFKGRSGYAQVYGRLTAQCVRDHLSGRYDLITWVPLSPERLKKRGYDQAMLLACATALELGDVAVETLRKVRDAEAQSGLAGGAGARRANVLGAYQAADPELVAGRRVLLIDDVITTGATISECARTLRTAGAADVLCATLARTPGPQKERSSAPFPPSF
ncbi:ComF family protein [Intestinimonas butyriciproducens]|uniref:ComF family protein n=1 Tax=Intestinimonas butyriciproducens TaxID=1297617 RepID=UPI00051AAF4C|nr:ComF family protein [Intestinimonas butyriciproducens]MCB7050406.1 ComF family protein [Intestinimonas butyriciproducens]